LERKFDYSHKVSDTEKVKDDIVGQLKEGISGGFIRGAFSTCIRGTMFLFTHAGLRPAMMESIKRLLDTEYLAAADYEKYINSKLTEVIQRCSASTSKLCELNDQLFQAGPERGGRGIGGPFWTDFDVLQKADRDSAAATDFVQVVGHSIELNRIRVTVANSAICVDAGMFLGGRAYLELIDSGAALAHRNFAGSWRTINFSEVRCR
jgi:hypothetical protein